MTIGKRISLELSFQSQTIKTENTRKVSSLITKLLAVFLKSRLITGGYIVYIQGCSIGQLQSTVISVDV